MTRHSRYRPGSTRLLALAAALLVAGAAPRLTHARDSARGTPSRSAHPGDSAAVVATAARLHELFEQDDSASALRLLADDLAVLESGGYEDRSEFRRHHLPADIEFARAVKMRRVVRSVVVRGDVAWLSSTSISQGEFRGRAVNSAGAELMVMLRDASSPTGWKIAAIHWSSRRRS